ncbi:hypothetical protein IG631_09636 [Alternaria alternata]|nr:hypothetical protein IG631_09636 [Alternaria alternata]
MELLGRCAVLPVKVANASLVAVLSIWIYKLQIRAQDDIKEDLEDIQFQLPSLITTSTRLYTLAIVFTRTHHSYISSKMSVTHEMIRNTVARVAVAIDQHDWDLLSTLFSSDATVVYPAPIGAHKDASSFRRSLQDALKGLSSHHALTTQTISLTQMCATVTTYVTTYTTQAEGGIDVHTSYGTYEDELVMEDVDGVERWRIKTRLVSAFPN